MIIPADLREQIIHHLPQQRREGCEISLPRHHHHQSTAGAVAAAKSVQKSVDQRARGGFGVALVVVFQHFGDGGFQSRYFALGDGGENRLLVGKILVERADTKTRAFGDAICSEAFLALVMQNMNGGVDNHINRVFGARLLRLSAKQISELLLLSHVAFAPENLSPKSELCSYYGWAGAHRKRLVGRACIRDNRVMFEGNVLKAAFPFVIAFCFLEALVTIFIFRRAFPWGEAVASIGVAIGQRLKALVFTSIIVAVFTWFYQFRLFDVPMNRWWSLPALFLALEFVYYWHHRLSHEVRWLWATHAVHHTPNHLNFFAAIRLGWTGEISGSLLLFVPLVLVGFPPIAALSALAINLLYQFWIHSEDVPKLGALEGILNTPSNHRVHHAANALYLDRNYGGVTVIFDRLFGTYQPEVDDVACRYGLVHPLTSNNPIVIAFHEWVNLWRDLRAATNWRDRLLLLVKPPGWKPDGSGQTSDQMRAALRAQNAPQAGE